jgi:hypothetical protein
MHMRYKYKRKYIFFYIEVPKGKSFETGDTMAILIKHSLLFKLTSSCIWLVYWWRG